MSKTKQTSPPQAPTFANSTLNIGGNDIAKTYTDASGNLITQYAGTPAENSAYQLYQSLINQYVPQVNTFTPEYYTQRDAQLQALQDLGTSQINDIYNPMIQSEQSDITSRFGSLTNSSFINDLNNIEKQRSNAISNLVNNLISTSNELDNSQLAKNYDYISLLTGLNNNYLQNAYNAINASRQGSNLLNSFNLGDQEYINDYYNNTSDSSSSLMPFYVSWF